MLFSLSYRLDNEPPAGVGRFDLSYTTGLPVSILIRLRTPGGFCGRAVRNPSDGWSRSRSDVFSASYPRIKATDSRCTFSDSFVILPD